MPRYHPQIPMEILLDALVTVCVGVGLVVLVAGVLHWLSIRLPVARGLGYRRASHDHNRAAKLRSAATDGTKK